MPKLWRKLWNEYMKTHGDIPNSADDLMMFSQTCGTIQAVSYNRALQIYKKQMNNQPVSQRTKHDTKQTISFRSDQEPNQCESEDKHSLEEVANHYDETQWSFPRKSKRQRMMENTDEFQNTTQMVTNPRLVSNGITYNPTSCLRFSDIDRNTENDLFLKLIQDSLLKYGEDCGKVDVMFSHNRHSLNGGFADVYFEKQSDAQHIHSLCKRRKLIYNKNSLGTEHHKDHKVLSCEWMEKSNVVPPLEGPEYLMNAELKGLTKMVMLQNLVWNETIWNIRDQLKQLTIELRSKQDLESSIDLEPRWIRILEYDNGYSSNMALVEMRDPKMAQLLVEEFMKNGRRLSARDIQAEYSSFIHRGGPFYHFDTMNQEMSGKSQTIVLTNLRADIKDSKQIQEFLRKITGWTLMKFKERIKDLYLIHNLVRVTGGKCLVRFMNTQSAAECMQYLAKGVSMETVSNMEYGYARSVLAKFISDEPEQIERFALRGHTNQLMVSNLPWDANEEIVKAMFSSEIRDEIDAVTISVTPSGYPNGQCTVCFNSVDAATMAMEEYRQNEHESFDESSFARNIHVDYTFSGYQFGW